MPVHGQLLAFARSYLDASQNLCDRLCTTVQKANYADGAVVMSLAFHSLELFFKSGIVRLCPNESFSGNSGHDLARLSARFFKLYPKREFQFKVPFRWYEFAELIVPTLGKETVVFQANLQKERHILPEDQRHRYPNDNSGKPWSGVFGFEPRIFLVTLHDLQATYARICPMIIDSVM